MFVISQEGWEGLVKTLVLERVFKAFLCLHECFASGHNVLLVESPTLNN